MTDEKRKRELEIVYDATRRGAIDLKGGVEYLARLREPTSEAAERVGRLRQRLAILTGEILSELRDELRDE